jgi:hypothetical protein
MMKLYSTGKRASMRIEEHDYLVNAMAGCIAAENIKYLLESGIYCVIIIPSVIFCGGQRDCFAKCPDYCHAETECSCLKAGKK